MQQQSTAEHAPSGLAALPSLAWGCHVVQIYNSAGDLRETLVPYFRAGLENNERCLWVTDAPFDANDARDALRAAVPDFDQRERQGQIEIQNTQAFYDTRRPLDPTALVAGLLQREREAFRCGLSWAAHQRKLFADRARALGAAFSITNPTCSSQSSGGGLFVSAATVTTAWNPPRWATNREPTVK
jgi:hypothetical protein